MLHELHPEIRDLVAATFGLLGDVAQHSWAGLVYFLEGQEYPHSVFGAFWEKHANLKPAIWFSSLKNCLKKRCSLVACGVAVKHLNSTLFSDKTVLQTHEELVKASEVHVVVFGQTGRFPLCILLKINSDFCHCACTQVYFAVNEAEILSLRFVAGLDGGPRSHSIFSRCGVGWLGLRFDTKLWDFSLPALIKGSIHPVLTKWNNRYHDYPQLCKRVRVCEVEERQCVRWKKKVHEWRGGGGERSNRVRSAHFCVKIGDLSELCC